MTTAQPERFLPDPEARARRVAEILHAAQQRIERQAAERQQKKAS